MERKGGKRGIEKGEREREDRDVWTQAGERTGGEHVGLVMHRLRLVSEQGWSTASDTQQHQTSHTP